MFSHVFHPAQQNVAFLRLLLETSSHCGNGGWSVHSKDRGGHEEPDGPDPAHGSTSSPVLLMPSFSTVCLRFRYVALALSNPLLLPSV